MHGPDRNIERELAELIELAAVARLAAVTAVGGMLMLADLTAETVFPDGD